MKEVQFEIDKRENIQVSSLKHYHSSQGKIHKNENKFLMEIYIGVEKFYLEVTWITSHKFLMLLFGCYNVHVCCDSKSMKTHLFYLFSHE